MKHKKIIALLLCLVLSVVLCLPVFAKDENNNFTLRVGYFLGYGFFENKNGGLYGYSHEYMSEIAAINGWDIKFIPCEWGQGIDMLERGEIDTFGGMQKTPEREQMFDFPDYNMGNEYGSIFAKDDNSEIFYDDFKSIDGKILGITDNNYYQDAILDYCEKNGISITLKVMTDNKLMDEELQNGTIDLRVAGSMLMPDNSKIVLQFTNEEFYFPTTKGNTFVLNGLNYALKEISRKNIYYNAYLYNKYYTNNSMANIAFTSAEEEYIKNAGVINVGYEELDAPIEYYNGQTNMPSGILIDLLEQVSKYSGLKFNFVRSNEFGTSVEKLKAQELDLISGFTNDASFISTHKLSVTEPILDTKLVFIYSQGNEIAPGELELALTTDLIGIEQQIRENYNAKSIWYYNTQGQCLDAIIKGDVNVAVLNAYSAENALKPYKYESLAITNMVHNNIPIRLAALKAAPKEMVSVINKSISSLNREQIDNAIHKNTIGMPYTPSVSDTLRYYSPFIITLIIIVFYCVLFLMSRSKNKLNKIAFLDELTGEMNLSKFKIEAQRLIHNGKHEHAVVIVDIDNFKMVNDIYGYSFGDKVLVFVAKALRSSLRSDVLVARGTADKFYCFTRFDGEEISWGRFATLSKRIEEMEIDGERNCKITVSVGICVVRAEDVNIVSVIDRANIASKKHKALHSSSYVFYNQSMYDKISYVKEIEDGMKDGIKNHEFQVYLQPKIELCSASVTGAEALVRWQHPLKGFMPPNDFIPIFENNGFVVNIDYYVFEEVCKLITRWISDEQECLVISVNLSRRHLENEDTPRLLNEIAVKHNTPTKYIEIELTESAFVDCDVEVIREFLDEFHRYGFTVSVDDFGAGYSSLSLLKDLPVDVLKIDKAFFDNNENLRAEVILESIIDLSHKMKIKTVSEGVENESQIALLQGLGCDLVQGFYFARPMPIKQMEEYVQRVNNIKKTADI